VNHCFSQQPFSKDKFEFVLQSVLVANGKRAELPRRANPGHDIWVGNERLSLKTEAAANINVAKIHISKFMELGGGEWSDKPEQLAGLRQQFLRHIQNYERIFTLRCIEKPPPHY